MNFSPCLANSVRLIRAASIALIIAGSRCGASSPQDPPREFAGFRSAQRVTILGYSGDAMEPFITRDGRYLLFNNSNDPAIDTNLHYARFIDDVTFRYLGEIEGVNTDSLDAVATADQHSNVYFISTRSYATTLSTVYRGRFLDGKIVDIELVDSVSEKKRGRVNFDVEVSAEGDVLLLSDGTFSGGPAPVAADLTLAVRRGREFQRVGEADLLRSVNSSLLEYAAALSADGLELFFTRVQDNQPAIYRAARSSTDMTFGIPERVRSIEGFAEAPALSPDQRSLYFHKREDGRFAIYRVTRG